jgi:hypothetical protein
MLMTEDSIGEIGDLLIAAVCFGLVLDVQRLAFALLEPLEHLHAPVLPVLGVSRIRFEKRLPYIADGGDMRVAVQESVENL